MNTNVHISFLIAVYISTCLFSLPMYTEAPGVDATFADYGSSGKNYFIKGTELGTFKWWISGLMLNLLFCGLRFLG